MAILHVHVRRKPSGNTYWDRDAIQVNFWTTIPASRARQRWVVFSDNTPRLVRVVTVYPGGAVRMTADGDGLAEISDVTETPFVLALGWSPTSEER